MLLRVLIRRFFRQKGEADALRVPPPEKIDHDKVKKAESFAQREKIEEGRAVAGESKHGFEDPTEDRKDDDKQKQIAQ